MTDPERAHPGRGDDTHRPGTIVVSGTGRVAVEPDLAELRLGVAIGRPTVVQARADAADMMSAILAALDVAGIERRDVRTTLLSVQPRYDYRDGQSPTLTGYDLTNTVEATIRDLTALAAVVDGALGAGATSLDGLTFRVADPSAAERAARLAAMAVARSRAEVLAEAAGVALAGVLDVVEGGAPPVGPWPKAERMMALAADSPVEAGTTEVAVTVTVTFRID
jgi:uncharacterized protein YggE